MNRLCLLLFGFLLASSCTYSITMVHTEGQATDVVDEVQSNTPDVKTSISPAGLG
jgi:hypothetical protein